MKTTYPRILLLYVPAKCISTFQPTDVVFQRPLKCAFAKKLKLWSASKVQRIVASKMSVGAMKVDSSMKAVRENLTEWMFMAWDKLRVHKEMIASSWTRCEILKAWDFQIQIEAMRVNFEKYLFGELGDLVED